MSKELNSQFINNAKAFFKNNFVFLPDDFCLHTGLGLAQVDFNYYPDKKAVTKRIIRGLKEIPAVDLSRFSPEEEEVPGDFDFVPVYFLPSLEHKVTTIQLGSDADFFFTTTLNGCRIEIGEGNTPEILHIAGGFSNERQVEIGDQHFIERRHRGQCYIPDHGYYNADNAVFYGIRNKRNNRWRFYMQGYDDLLWDGRLLTEFGLNGEFDFKRLYTNKRI